MLDDNPQAAPESAESESPTATPAKKAAKRATAKRTAKKAVAAESTPAETGEAEPAKKTAAKRAATKKAVAKKAPAKKASTSKRTTTKKAAAKSETIDPAPETDGPAAGSEPKPAEKKSAEKKSAGKKAAGKKAKADAEQPAESGSSSAPAPATDDEAAAPTGAMPLFQAPEVKTRTRRAKKAEPDHEEQAPEPAKDQARDQALDQAPAQDATAAETGEASGSADSTGSDESSAEEGTGGRRRRRRGGRRRRKGDPDAGGDAGTEDQSSPQDGDSSGEDKGQEKGRKSEGKGGQSKGEQPKGNGKGTDKGDDKAQDDDAEGGSRRRRRRRRSGESGEGSGDDPQKTVTKVRKARSPEDEITSVSGSTRLEAKKQRRREGREAGRRRAPIVTEAEFLARRESVDRVMAIRQRDDLTQIAVLEDRVLVEHYVARESQTSLIGNVYLGRVQNVLPSMEAAFIDIGKGRNAVIYAGEVNWSALGHKDGQPRKIESVLSSGQTILVQVTKDPVGHKGARLTAQVSLAGRFLVYVPDGTTSGISRKLPDTERTRLKSLLKEIVPDSAGVIVRTAAEGASEEELTRDVERLKARWEDIEKKSKGSAPQLLYGEPDLTLKVVRDLFTEDFSKLVIEGDDVWETVRGYVEHVAPDLIDRLERHDRDADNGRDCFAKYRIDEQIAKGLDRKVWLPSGGSLVIDRTEAMTVVDVNTGKFTGSGGNLEETVTKNNLEAAEEIVRQLRLRDIGGIIVIDFIDMVLESNRDLVLRRLVECLGRDRTRHQVAEVTSLGLVQMTRKRIGTGLLEAFSHTCEHCAGRGVLLSDLPVADKGSGDEPRRGRRRGRGRGADQPASPPAVPSPKDLAAVARPPAPEAPEAADTSDDATPEAGATDAGPAEPAAAAEAGRSAEPTDPEPTEAIQATEATEATEAAEPADPAEPAAAAEPVAPEPPKVVTRTRRRSARRPAGPPAAEEPGRTDSLASAPSVSGPSTNGSLPAEVPANGSGPTTSTVELATDPQAEGTDHRPDGAPDGGPDPAEEEPPQIEHVPIKRRGSRKR